MARYVFRDLSGLNTVLSIFICTTMLAIIACIVSDIMQIILLSKDTFEIEDAEANDFRHAIIHIGRVCVHVISGLIFFRWLFIANKNVRALGAKDLVYTPGWMIGCYFVPIANLIWPCYSMIELSKASKSATSWQTQLPDSRVGIWWALIILWYITDRAADRLTRNSENAVKNLIQATYITLVSEVILLLCGIALLMVISNIWRDQAAQLISDEYLEVQANEPE